MSQHSGRWRIIALFFIHALTAGAIHTRIPDIQVALGLSEGALGLTLMGQPIGGLVMFLFSSHIIERFGPRRTVLGFLPIMGLAPALIPLVPGAMVMFVLMGFIGLSFSLTNIAMNVEADRIEAASGRRLMNTCHGAWSFGFLLTSLAGAAARGFAISPAIHLWALMPLVLLALGAIVVPMRPAPERPHGGGVARRRLALPSWATMGLVGFGLGAALLEGGTRTWSIIYMRDSFAVPAWVESMTLPALLIAMAACRMVADRWIDRFGPVHVARVLTLVAIAGLAAVVFAPGYAIALLGFGLIGVGICVAFPLMLSAAARIGDRPSSENVAATTLIIQVTGLMAPPLMGAVAQGFGIRMTFALMLPLLVLSLALSGRLAPRAAPSPQPA